jgi:hypothetical protein
MERINPTRRIINKQMKIKNQILYKKSEVALLLHDKADFKPKLEETGHFILIMKKIDQEEITVVNIYTHNVGSLNLIKQTTGQKSTDRLQQDNSV